jgi:hypothetical protein
MSGIDARPSAGVTGDRVGFVPKGNTDHVSPTPAPNSGVKVTFPSSTEVTNLPLRKQ